MSTQNIYASIIEGLFLDRYRPGKREIEFRREDIVRVATRLKIDLPKNLGDLIYSFRYRASLPRSIQRTARAGEAWIIRPAGRSLYRFVLTTAVAITPNANMLVIKVPDATPGIVGRYAFNDEQALLARLRYNRLLDVFTGTTCYSLQNHLRTTVPGIGQVETDEIYVGLDKKGVHYVFPIQAKTGTDKLSIVQIEQDFAVCGHKFVGLVCRPVAARFMERDTIALFEFGQDENGVGITSERHYKLVPSEELSDDELRTYRENTA
jgi:hypothetical protein